MLTPAIASFGALLIVPPFVLAALADQALLLGNLVAPSEGLYSSPWSGSLPRRRSSS